MPLVAALLILSAAPTSAQVSKNEGKCAGKMAKSAGKLAAAVTKGTAKCRDKEIAGKYVGSCPGVKEQTKIDKAVAKVDATAIKSCGSVCSSSTFIGCLADSDCPPTAGLDETCGGGAVNKPFEIRNIGFPGPACIAAGYSTIDSADDLSGCVGGVALEIGEGHVALIYGSSSSSSGLSSAAASCQATLAKSAVKLVATVVKGVSKCRDAINKGKSSGSPLECATADEKLVAKIAKAEAKFGSGIAAKCSDAGVTELDICGLGVGGVTSVGDATACLLAASREISDAVNLPADRTYAARSLIEAAYPREAVCGDNSVNQLPGNHLLLGEECDGSDDSACPGECMPPGDLFECTCGDVPRARWWSLTPGSETDAGWTGSTHDQRLGAGGGFLVDLLNCDCTEFTGATCTGTSVDSVCDLVGKQAPRCSWEPSSASRCDDRGDGNGEDEDGDCAICDAWSVNAGANCALSTDCQSRCYTAAGVDAGSDCDSQADCAAGEQCRGRCDSSPHCIFSPNGGPFAVASSSTTACNVQNHVEDVTGTLNIITGEHSTAYESSNRPYIGERSHRPCPVCGGYCEGGDNAFLVCQGRCETSGDECRFDEDCSIEGELCGSVTPDCPGGACELGLVCIADQQALPGAVSGRACRVEYVDPLYGSMSGDCPPHPGKYLGGRVESVHIAHTSHPTSLASTLPCTELGFELFDCPCPAGVSNMQTKPNLCRTSCDAGAELGTGCADGNNAGGEFTTCAGGGNQGLACDEDSDCPGGACSANPTHCSGDPAFERVTCNNDADCGLGTCVDACPSGRCIPQCLPKVGDGVDGYCPAGPDVFHCEGVLDAFRSCPATALDESCNSTCSVAGTACSSDTECPVGEQCSGECLTHINCESGVDGFLGTPDDNPGAGACVQAVRECFTNPILAEGGSTLNGDGDPTNIYSSTIYCIPPTTRNVIDLVSGFGGPGRTQERATLYLNVSSIPVTP